MGKKWHWAVGVLVGLVAIYLSSTTVITMRQLAQFVSSVVPGVTEDGFYEWWQTWWWVFVKGFHVLEFFALAVVAGLTLRRFGVEKWIGWGAGIAFVYACSDEWHQTFVPARGGRVSDVLIDSVGIGLAVLVMIRFAKREVRAPDLVPEQSEN